MSTNTAIQNVKKLIYDNISYTSQDYETIMGELIELMPQLSSNWNNISEADIIFIMLSLMSAHKDILNYMLDYRILESYMSTAKERASLVRIANSFGYKIPSYKAAKADLTLATGGVSGSGYTFPLRLQSFTQFTDDSNVPWAYVGPDIEINESDTIEVYQGIIKTEVKSLSGIDQQSMTYVISNQNIAIGNNANTKGCSRLTITKNNELPIEFTEVQNIYTYTGDSELIYELNVDPQGLTYIKFLKNFNISSYLDYNVNFQYIVTQGSTVTSISEEARALLKHGTSEYYSYISSFNYVPGSFTAGSSAATATEIREGFKNYYANSNSLITLSDYRNFILEVQKAVPNISKCLIIDSQSSTLSTALGSEDFYITATAGAETYNISYFGIYVLTETESGGVINYNTDLTVNELSALKAVINDHRIAGISASYNGETVGQPLERLEVSIVLNKLPANAILKAELKEMIAGYINSKEIGEDLTSTELYSLIIDSKFAPEYEKGLSITIKNISADPIELSTDILELAYYNYMYCSVDNIILA